MFYKFNSISGRLSSAHQLEAYTPQGLTGKEAVSAPFIWHSSDIKDAKTVSSGGSAAVAGHGHEGGRGVVPNTESYKKLMKLQADWAKSTHLLVWQRRPIDGFLFYTTLALTALGTAYVGTKVYEILFPAKKK